MPSASSILIDDAAYTHCSSLNGKLAGSFGDAAAFSFYSTKVMTSGSGRVIITNDEKSSANSIKGK